MMKKHLSGSRLRTLIWYDLNYGYQSTRLKWLGVVLVQAYFVILACQCCSAPETPGGMLGHLSFLFRGMPEYFVSETGKFELPVPWLMLNACLLFLTASYPAEDLTRSGGQAIVRADRRRDWLLGKAAWVACTVAAYYLLLAAALALGALVTESAGMGDLAAGAPARGDFLGLRDFRDGLYGISPETRKLLHAPAPGLPVREPCHMLSELPDALRAVERCRAVFRHEMDKAERHFLNRHRHLSQILSRPKWESP